MSFKIERWIPVDDRTVNSGLKAVVWCPDCNGRIGIRGHEISKTGELTPSLVCPHEGCGFHEYVHLRDFDKLGKGIIAANAAAAKANEPKPDAIVKPPVL